MITIWRKRISLFLLTLCLFLSAWGAAQAAPAAAGQVGYVDFIYLVDQHPDTAEANAALKTEQEKAKQEFTSKAAGLSDKEKQELDRQLGQRVEQKRLELLQPISANEVVCGGVNITADVLKKITGK